MTPSHHAVSRPGRFALDLDVVLADGELGYGRCTQDGHHLGEVDGLPPTGRPVRQVTSAVYRVADVQIHEYWIRIDRFGLAAQLTDPTV